MASDNRNVLILYTGGTIGMAENPQTGAFTPLDFDHLYDHIPELQRLSCSVSCKSLGEVIDSSDADPTFWKRIAGAIYSDYEHYDGFVVLHGTDTMAYTASAISFMLTGLQKPVIFTGSQLPIGMIRTDGKENLLTSVEIAASYDRGEAVVQEVCIYFENLLFRANRARKFNSEHFDAFTSPNYPVLAEAGVHIRFEADHLWRSREPLCLNTQTDERIALLKLYPGIDATWLIPALKEGKLKGLVMETYGAGNAPCGGTLESVLRLCNEREIPVVNITQCYGGAVYPVKYESGKWLETLGVINGRDLSTESAVCKLMMALGRFTHRDEIRGFVVNSCAGEIEEVM